MNISLNISFGTNLPYITWEEKITGKLTAINGCHLEWKMLNVIRAKDKIHNIQFITQQTDPQ